MDCRKQDIVGENCVRNGAGDVALPDKDKMKAWLEHYARLLNVEIVWPSNELPGVSPTAPPLPVCPYKALSKMKCNKAAGPSGIVAEEGVEPMRQLTCSVFSCEMVPSDWEESFTPKLCKSKGDAYDHSSYRGPKFKGSGHETAVMGTKPQHPRDGEHWWDAIRLCAL